jgi:hypothetical protein
MVPFLVLVVAFALLRLVGLVGVGWRDDWQAALHGTLALMFCSPLVCPWPPKVIPARNVLIR